MEAYNRKKDGVKFSTIHPSYIAKGMFEGHASVFRGASSFRWSKAMM